MNEYTEKAEAFLKKHGIKFKAVRTGYGPYFPDDKESRDIYRLELLRASFRRGEYAPTSKAQRASFRDTKNGEAPTAYDLLARITKSDPGTFEDFCGNFGYDTDSRRAERIYKGVCREWQKVQRFFTAEEIEELQEID